MLSRRVSTVLVDLSGSPIDGAVQALDRLRQSGVRVFFVSNTTKESGASLMTRLRSIGFAVGEDEVVTSLSAARTLVESRRLRPLLFLSDDARKQFDGVDTADPNAVVVGLAPAQFDYAHLNAAFRLLNSNPDAAFIALNKSRYYERTDGLALGAGAFVSALEFSTGRTAEVVGKPSRSFFHTVLSRLGASPATAVMIGDDALDDVFGAQEAGLAGILVKTGKYRSGDETRAPTPPDAVCDSFTHAVDALIASGLLDPIE